MCERLPGEGANGLFKRDFRVLSSGSKLVFEQARQVLFVNKRAIAVILLSG